MDLSGQQLNDYRLLRQIGRGAMAIVYLAEQESLARRVAVKVLNSELANDRDQVERFQREARAAASLTHPGIVQVHEVGSSRDLYFLVQEYLPGGSLGDLLNRQGRLSPGAVLGVLWQVSEALAEAASRGLVHRDIKPDNLMLDRSGAVKVADFGLARIAEAAARVTREGVALGTPLYMSPEQVEAKPLDSRSDLYSLGVTAFHLLTGEPPFTGDTPLAVAMQHISSAPPKVSERDPTVPASLANIIDRLLVKDPEGRFESPAELSQALAVLSSVSTDEGWADTTSGSSPKFPLLASASTVGEDLTLERDRLSRAMQSERRRGRRSLIGLAAAIGVGGLLGWLLRPGPLLPSPTSPDVAREASVARQLLLAKRVNTPEAWRAIERYYPDADELHQLLAIRGLAECLLDRDRFGLAEFELRRLGERGVAYNEFAAFSHAGLAIAYARTGRTDDAMTELDRLDRLDERLPGQLSEEVARVRAGLRDSG